jgi:hypothetical protein
MSYLPPGPYGNPSCHIPTHFQWDLLIDRQTIGDLRSQDARLVVISAAPSATDIGSCSVE